MHRPLIWTVLALLPFVGSAANIYKCEVDGVVVFSQTPCAEDAVEIDESKLDSSAGLSTPPEQLEQTAERIDKFTSNQHLQLRIRRIRERSNATIRGYRRDRDNCENKIRFANNNLAGATWEASLRECVNNYEKLMSDERLSADRRIAELRDRIDR